MESYILLRSSFFLFYTQQSTNKTMRMHSGNQLSHSQVSMKSKLRRWQWCWVDSSASLLGHYRQLWRTLYLLLLTILWRTEWKESPSFWWYDKRRDCSFHLCRLRCVNFFFQSCSTADCQFHTQNWVIALQLVFDVHLNHDTLYSVSFNTHKSTPRAKFSHTDDPILWQRLRTIIEDWEWRLTQKHTYWREKTGSSPVTST